MGRIHPSQKNNYIRVNYFDTLELASLGVTNLADIKSFRIMKILGQHFRCGEWGQQRCGSVVTTMLRNVSRYCIVERFVVVQQKAFAMVTWFQEPTYPYAPNPLVVRVRLSPRGTSAEPSRRFLPVVDIIPTSVAVVPDSDGVHFFVMRSKGTDRTRFTRRGEVSV